MNEPQLDLVVRHQIDLIRYSNGVLRRIMALLNRADGELFARLSMILEELPAESYSVERLEAMLASIRRLNADAYAQLTLALEDSVRELAGSEVEWNEAFYKSVPESVAMNFSSVTAESAYTAALARPFQSRLLREWAAGIEAGRMARIRDTIRLGYLEGQTNDQIVRRVRGTKSKGYRDGIIEIDRRHAETIVHSALMHTAAVARERFHEENEDLVPVLQWISQLDARTSAPCRIRDHKQYRNDEGHKPIGHSLPWGGGPGAYHLNCRSSSIGLLKGQKSLFGTRASVQYKDGERPKGAQVDANESYGQWLRRQPAEVQNDILGETKGRLFRAGKMEIEQFANDRGRELSIDELKAKYPSAFKRAAIQ